MATNAPGQRPAAQRPFSQVRPASVPVIAARKVVIDHPEHLQKVRARVHKVHATYAELHAKLEGFQALLHAHEQAQAESTAACARMGQIRAAVRDASLPRAEQVALNLEYTRLMQEGAESGLAAATIARSIQARKSSAYADAQELMGMAMDGDDRRAVLAMLGKRTVTVAPAAPAAAPSRSRSAGASAEAPPRQ